MSGLSRLIARYARASTTTRRKAAAREILASNALASLDADDEAFALLMRARTLGIGESEEDSPVILAAPHLTRARDLFAMAFQRWLSWHEVVAVRSNPLWPSASDAALLDQLSIGERPAVRFDAWLDAEQLDWRRLMTRAETAGPARRLIGPASPLEPRWLEFVDRFADRFRSEDAGRWLLRCAGFAGHWAVDRLRARGLSVAASAFDAERDALRLHPDATVAALAARAP